MTGAMEPRWNRLMEPERPAEADVTAPRSTTSLTPRRATVFKMLVDAADNGLPAPTDMAIAEMIGIRSLGSANLRVMSMRSRPAKLAMTQPMRSISLVPW